ncbi:N-acyltransferase YncA [Thalassovita gelatinovora]|uniref:N-acyltransferase YncA n=1 Tax=Thalassovita gelatinovora TaxID=53501 RepID=A0A0P1F823_THAGE|nr:GNAT family N-acetyltransferase [Thalassovita gelatinovora]QIZ80218.1 N-acetyltransferase [Thalassovita gelatinovora]CUH64072.1 N-acyltransferase YncA [Thalassovita gelatinovora]SEQ82737.1 phosphinothricin acetyltransferase [Thalassovita gelatinovora]
MTIRDARPKDADAVADIWNHIIRDTAATFTTLEKTPQDLIADIAAKQAEGKAFLVVEQAGQVAGFATYFQFRGGPGYRHTMEHTIHIAPQAQGQGLGRDLMIALEDHARATGVHSLFAGVSGDNPGGVGFHAALGYREIARLPQVGRKFERWMDLVLMQKIL